MKKVINQLMIIVNNIDLLFLLYYITSIHHLTLQRNNPSINTTPVIVSTILFWLISIISLYICSVFLNNKNAFFEKIAGTFEKKSFPFFLNLLSLISGIIILSSISYSLYQHSDILMSAGSFGLRAISTSLHPLVPLESRWIYLLGPWIFLLDTDQEKYKYLRFLNIIILIALIFLTQTKLNFIFLIFFSIILIFTNFLKNFSFSKLLLYVLIIVISTKGINTLLFNSTHGEEVTLSNQKIINIKVENNWINTPSAPQCNTFSSKVAPQTPEVNKPIALIEIYQSLQYRIFGTSSKVTNLFFCLREKGNWRPQFRGQQLARLVGLYKPVYRWAMEYVDPSFGATAATSAVANFVTDSYLNAGYFGVILATFLSIVGWAILKKLSSRESQNRTYFYYLRFLFVFILISQSFISALVILAFLLLTLVTYNIARSQLS